MLIAFFYAFRERVGARRGSFQVHPRYKDLGHATVFGDQVDIDASTLASLLSAQGPKRPVARKTEGIKALLHLETTRNTTFS